MARPDHSIDLIDEKDLLGYIWNWACGALCIDFRSAELMFPCQLLFDILKGKSKLCASKFKLLALCLI